MPTRHYWASNPPGEELPTKLVQVTPERLNHVFNSDSGSTAVEIALKQAFQYWQLLGKTEKTGQRACVCRGPRQSRRIRPATYSLSKELEDYRFLSQATTPWRTLRRTSRCRS
ncbi:MAG: aminotransferase class III-fold pyridoxal phosphate-dependent enzyme [Myxococcales bacterium]|nr:aminotransferase class III-fold pyridoxal phosphate-dependent enzyme [Myxococcales bacterium]